MEGRKMSIVKHTDKRSGVTYVYESESYWDKEKKQSRSTRKLLGRLDEETGGIIPTDGRGRKKRFRYLARLGIKDAFRVKR